MICKHGSANIRRIVNYTGRKLLAVFVIIAIGFAFMYFTADITDAIFMGVGCLIAMAAIIIVMIADDYERKLKLLFKVARS